MCLYGRVHACWVANFLSISSKRRKRKASSLTLNIIHKTRNKEKEIPTTTRILNWIGLRSFFWLLLITIICLFVLCLKLGELWLLALMERNFTLGPPHITVCDLHQHCAFVFICGSYGCQNPNLDPMILWSHLPKTIWIIQEFLQSFRIGGIVRFWWFQTTLVSCNLL